ncbi:hypothetical protein FF100_25495 [Methylobacterium terricola]|uniref:Uncharacterized protein n=1 Tax=Methylobacterium terricola TaxID=2583531 RepID=A0A5C4LBW5_9HYPH|nr:hypothetical protein [Methylobacterium terricola]TNC09573.1 hypothetical protein FF100_25495 [Methylobacterium terricola]
MPPRIAHNAGDPPGGAGPLGLIALALAILAAGLLLEGHPVDASVSPQLAASEAPARPLPSPETMLRDMIGRD